nr:MAG TPA: hypothetical protein [Caudoviricetes sp.]
MSYSKINWVDGAAPALNATNLNRMDDGIYNNSIDIALAGDNINTLSERIIAINTALSAKADKTELEDEITDIDETVTMKINLKADKDSVDNAVAQLSKQIADNKSSADESISTLSQTVTDNKTATDKSLAAKYDSSNFESGSGELSPTQTIYEGSAGKFVYVKNGDAVTVSVNITSMLADKDYLQMSGLPFPSKTESKLASIAVYSTKNKLRNVRIDGSWIYISSPSDKFAEGEKMNFIITYIIK